MHPWIIKDISKEGSEIYKIKDQTDIELFSEKIQIIEYEESNKFKELTDSQHNIIIKNENITLRDILNDYFS